MGQPINVNASCPASFDSELADASKLDAVTIANLPHFAVSDKVTNRTGSRRHPRQIEGTADQRRPRQGAQLVGPDQTRASA
jgi:hypothetical protein